MKDSDITRKPVRNTCPTCGGRMTFDITSFFHYARGRTYLIENVPTDFCPECGERLYHAKVMKSIEGFLSGEYPVKEILSIEVVALPDMPDYGRPEKGEAAVSKSPFIEMIG